jgi:hypothetical protein
MSKKTTLYVTSEETIVRKRQTIIKVEASYVQLYKNIRAYTLIMAPGSPTDLMLFLITRMNDNNGVHMNQMIIKEFISSLPKPITERQFYRVLKVLIKNNVVIPIARGEYKLNPAIVWQGDIGTRMEHIKFLEEGGVSLKPNESLLLDKKEDSNGITVIGDESSIPHNTEEESKIIEQAVKVLEDDSQNYQKVEVIEKPAEKMVLGSGKKPVWDTPIKYPKPKTGGFNG